MACGTPVITTRFGTEDYCYDNENSLVVLPEDANALSEAIIRLHDNPDLRDKLRRNGLKTVASMTWDRTAEEFNKVILGNTNNDT
jgi:glycosyltransferase involved in cell wall biosynthesis